MEPRIMKGAAGIYYNSSTEDSRSQALCVLYSLTDEADEFTKRLLSILTFVEDCNFSGCWYSFGWQFIKSNHLKK